MEFQDFTAKVGGDAVAFTSFDAHGCASLQIGAASVAFATSPCLARVGGCDVLLGPVFGRFLPAGCSVEIRGHEQAGQVCVIEHSLVVPIAGSEKERLMDWLLPLPPRLFMTTLLTYQVAFAPSAVPAEADWPALQILQAAWRSLVPRVLDPVAGPPTQRAMCLVARSALTPVQIDDLANKLSVSRGVLVHSFPQQTGMSLQDFRKHLRIRMAACVLLQRFMPLPELACRFGYSSKSQFGSDFAAIFRTTPSRLIPAMTARLLGEPFNLQEARKSEKPHMKFG